MNYTKKPTETFLKTILVKLPIRCQIFLLPRFCRRSMEVSSIFSNGILNMANNFRTDPSRRSRILNQIVSDYRERFKKLEVNELAGVRSYADFSIMLSNVAFARRPDGRRYRHQNRLENTALTLAASRLLKAEKELSVQTNFDNLLNRIESLVKSVHGIGELYVYDTALRISAFLDCPPEHVYIHNGTRDGARALGYAASCRFVKKQDFPSEFHSLEAHEIEDVLCIFKDKLRMAFRK